MECLSQRDTSKLPHTSTPHPNTDMDTDTLSLTVIPVVALAVGGFTAVGANSETPSLSVSPCRGTVLKVLLGILVVLACVVLFSSGGLLAADTLLSGFLVPIVMMVGVFGLMPRKWTIHGLPPSLVDHVVEKALAQTDLHPRRDLSGIYFDDVTSFSIQVAHDAFFDSCALVWHPPEAASQFPQFRAALETVLARTRCPKPLKRRRLTWVAALVLSGMIAAPLVWRVRLDRRLHGKWEQIPSRRELQKVVAGQPPR